MCTDLVTLSQRSREALLVVCGVPRQKKPSYGGWNHSSRCLKMGGGLAQRDMREPRREIGAGFTWHGSHKGVRQNCGTVYLRCVHCVEY